MNIDRLLLRVGLVVRRHREALKLTQEEFADMHGINRTYYGAIERGAQNLTLLNLARLAGGLDKSISELMRDAERLDLARAIKEPPRPPRRGRPKGSTRR